jgi:hypothetical protein
MSELRHDRKRSNLHDGGVVSSVARLFGDNRLPRLNPISKTFLQDLFLANAGSPAKSSLSVALSFASGSLERLAK